MNHLVKILELADGEVVVNPMWCLVDPGNMVGNATLCAGEIFGSREAKFKFEIKRQAKGGIECQLCLRKLKLYQEVKV